MARILVHLILAVAAFGQTPADLYVLEEYRAWVAKQPGVPALDNYKAYLIERGADSVDAETQIRTIRALEGQPSPFLAEMVKGRKPGKALEIRIGNPRDGSWLAQQGWDVLEIDPSKRTGRLRPPSNQELSPFPSRNRVRCARVPGEQAASPLQPARWDLIVLTGVDFRSQGKEIFNALRPGGIVVIEGTISGVAGHFPGLRAIRSTGTRYCGEKPR